MEYAQQLNWIPSLDHGVLNYGLLHKTPFFSVLDNKSKILICSKMRVLSFDPYNNESIQAVQAGEGRPITVEGMPGSDMYIILEGRVAVCQQHKYLGVLEQHQFFGEFAVLKPPRMDSYGQLHTRTHYAIGDVATIASLGYDDLAALRAERAEINDAVLPYVKEAMRHQVHANDWFYVEIVGANGLRAADSSSLESAGVSDPYAVLFVNDNLIAKTQVELKTLDPQWAETIAFTRAEATSFGKKATFKIEVYDYNTFGDPDFLGGAVCTFLDLCKDNQGYSDWTDLETDLPDEFTTLTLEDESVENETVGTIDIKLTNKNNKVHLDDDPSCPMATADVKTRGAAQRRRMVHLTDANANISEIKEQVVELKADVRNVESKLDAVLELLRPADRN